VPASIVSSDSSPSDSSSSDSSYDVRGRPSNFGRRFVLRPSKRRFDFPGTTGPQGQFGELALPQDRRIFFGTPFFASPDPRHGNPSVFTRRVSSCRELSSSSTSHEGCGSPQARHRLWGVDIDGLSLATGWCEIFILTGTFVQGERASQDLDKAASHHHRNKLDKMPEKDTSGRGRCRRAGEDDAAGVTV